MTGVRRLQLALVGSAALLLGAVVFYSVRNRPAGPADQAVRGGPRPAASATPPGSVAIGQFAEAGFNVRLERFAGADRRFTARAGKALTEKNGSTLLTDGVELDAEGQDGERYLLTAAEARGNADWSGVRASGGVRITRGDGLELSSEWMEHFGREGAEVAGGNVQVAHQGSRLRCDRAEYKLGPREFYLDGGLSFFRAPSGRRPAMAGAAEHLFLSRAKGELTLRDGVRLIAGGLGVEADRLDLTLLGSKPRRAVLRGHQGRDVGIEHWRPVPAGCPGTAALRRLRANALEVLFDGEGRPLRVAPLDAADTVVIHGFGPPDLLWSMTANQVEATLRPEGSLDRVVANNLRWRGHGGPGDSAPAGSLTTAGIEARFAVDGRLERAEFPRGLKAEREGGVRLEGGAGRLEGDLLRVTAEPALTSPGSVLRARTIEVDTRSGTVRAEGQVESEIREARSPFLGADPGQGPVRVKSDAMATRDAGRTVVYRGNARAWRGADVLQADEIAADRDLAGIEASGRVRVLLLAGERRDLAADRLRQDARSAVFEGHAALRSADLVVEAERITVRFGPDGRTAERIEAEGEEVFTERQGLSAWSRRVVHEIAADRTELAGDGNRPVRVRDEAGRDSWYSRLNLWRKGDRIAVEAGEEGIARTRLGSDQPARPGPGRP